MTGFSIQDCPLWLCSSGPFRHDFAKAKVQGLTVEHAKKSQTCCFSVFNTVKEMSQRQCSFTFRLYSCIYIKAAPTAAKAPYS